MPQPPPPVRLPDDEDEDEDRHYDENKGRFDSAAGSGERRGDGRRGGERRGEERRGEEWRGEEWRGDESRRDERRKGKRPIVSAPLGSPRQYSDRSVSSSASTPRMTPSPRESWGGGFKRTPATAGRDGTSRDGTSRDGMGRDGTSREGAGSVPAAKRPTRHLKPSPKVTPMTSPVGGPGVTRGVAKEKRDGRKQRHGQSSPNDRLDRLMAVAPPLHPTAKPARRTPSWPGPSSGSSPRQEGSRPGSRSALDAGGSRGRKERRHGTLSPTAERPLHQDRLQRAVSFAIVR